MDNKSLPSKVSYLMRDRKQWLELPFPMEEYEDRIARLRSSLVEQQLDAYLVYGNLEQMGNVTWIANYDPFKGNAFVLVPGDGPLALVTDSIFHNEPMHTEVWETWIEDVRAGLHPRFASRLSAMTSLDQLGGLLHERRLESAKIGLVGEDSIPHWIMNGLKDAFPQVNWAASTDAYLRVKAVKSAREVQKMREVARMGAAGIRAFNDHLRPGISEGELAGKIADVIFAAGAQTLYKQLALVGGPRSGFKHVHPGHRRFEKGDMVFTDIGGRYHGYLTDQSTCVTVGPPTAEQRAFMEAGKQMFIASFGAIKAGVPIGEVYATGQRVAQEMGFGDYTFGMGHGIGTIHAELPRIVRQSELPLKENMIFALEPMLIKTGFGCATYENQVLVKKDGAELLGDWELPNF
jgi:Xaa-Pro aminopeptidase